jgi:hypothetical protein
MHGVGPTISGRIVWLDVSQDCKKKGAFGPLFYLLWLIEKYTELYKL